MSRLGLIDPATGALTLVMPAGDYDAAREPAGLTTVAVPADWPDAMRWDPATLTFVADLSTLRARAVAAIDTAAERARSRYLTPGAGQAMTYQRKEAEARAFLADAGAETMFLSAEAPARAMSVAALAAEVVAQADAWAEVGSAIEALRMGAKAQVAAAATPDAIAAAAELTWPGDAA